MQTVTKRELSGYTNIRQYRLKVKRVLRDKSIICRQKDQFTRRYNNYKLIIKVNL